MELLTDIELTEIAEAVIKLTRLERWQAIDAAMSIHDKKWIAGLVPRFSAMEKEVNDKIDSHLAPLFQRAREPESQKAGEIQIKASVEQLLPDEGKWRVIFEEFGQLMLPGIISDAGQTGINVIMGVSFDIRNPRVTEFIENKKFKFAKEITETPANQLREQLRAGLLDGEGIPQLKKRVKEVFTDAKTWRAEMIARTETGGAYNFGSFEGYKQSGVVAYKEWLATKDNRTRDSHQHMDGQRQLLDNRFSNGLMYPGEPNGAIEEIANCRCSIAPIVEE